MRIHYATTNEAKAASLRRTFEDTPIEIVHVRMQLPEPRSGDITYIAKEKARFAYASLHQPVIVLDAGFFIRALNGFPRAFVNLVLDTIGIEGILRLMDGENMRSCEFRDCVAYLDGKLSDPMVFSSSVWKG